MSISDASVLRINWRLKLGRQRMGPFVRWLFKVQNASSWLLVHTPLLGSRLLVSVSEWCSHYSKVRNELSVITAKPNEGSNLFLGLWSWRISDLLQLVGLRLKLSLPHNVTQKLDAAETNMALCRYCRQVRIPQPLNEHIINIIMGIRQTTQNWPRWGVNQPEGHNPELEQPLGVTNAVLCLLPSAIGI